jgi:DNA-binding MarR family transcriptional regulator
VKTTQRAILAQIGRSEPVTVGALAEALVMDSGALAHTLKPLERDGLLAVAVDPADRRNRLISLTQQGRAKLAETDALWTKAQRCFEAAFGPAESESLREALRFLSSDGFAAAFEDTLSAPAR